MFPNGDESKDVDEEHHHTETVDAVDSTQHEREGTPEPQENHVARPNGTEEEPAAKTASPETNTSTAGPRPATT